MSAMKEKAATKLASLTYDIDDEQEELSVDPIQLNTTLLTFRPTVKKARLHVLRELAIYIKRLKQKQSVIADSKKPRIGKKILGRLSELRLLKKMNTIRLCKLLLANVSTPEEMEKAGQNMNKQDRLVVRMAARPEVAAFVKQFRTQHADWPALVHFLLYKNTSGKWKTSEQKRRRKKKNKGDLPFPIPTSVPLASDEGEGKDGEMEDVDVGCSTIKKFAAFKEAHDRRLLEEQKKLIADEEAEMALAPPLRPQAAIPPPPHHPFFPEEEEAANEMDADSDTASEIVANLIAHRSIVRQPSAPERNTEDKEEEEEEEEETRGKKNKRTSEQLKKPLPLTPSDDGALLPVQKPQKKAKMQKESFTKSSVTIPGKEVRKTAVMEETEPTKAAKINKPAPANAFFSEIIDGTEPESTPLSVDEDEALFGADDLELKTEIRAKKARDAEKTPTGRGGGAWQRGRGGDGSDRRGFRGGPRGGRGGRGDYSRKSQSDPVADTAGLHPSWVAKRELQKQATRILTTPAPGKRIVFED